MTGQVVEVAAAILLREHSDGSTEYEYLLARRPQGKVYAGYWEFPGGKVEPGENLRQALIRELHEELGITIDCANPWLSCRFTYPHATVRLKFFRVSSWHGEISPIEHDGFVWVKIGDKAPVSPVLPANGPILRALELPARYVLTCAAENGIAAELKHLQTALSKGVRLIQVRDKTLAPQQRQQFAASVLALTTDYPDARVLISDDEELARAVGAHGIHLSSNRLQQINQRPSFEWVAASCHNREELDRAATLGLDFTVLGPVLPTPSHPQTPGIGWAVFAQQIEQSPLPVFALGGMLPEMLETAWKNGAHGIAQMRGWQHQAVAGETQ